MVQVIVGRGGQLESAEADVVQRLVINAEGLVGVLNELVDGEGGIVGLNNSVRNLRRLVGDHCRKELVCRTDLGRWDNGECAHHTVGVLFTNLGDQKGAHTRAGTTTERVGDLKSLKAVGALSLLADDIEDRVDELSSLGIVWGSTSNFPEGNGIGKRLTSFRPVVTSAGLTKDEVVGAEQASKRTGPDRVHGSRLEINEDSTRNVFVRWKA